MTSLLLEGGVIGKINVGRVVLGGIVAGIVGNILGYLVDGLMLAPRLGRRYEDAGPAGVFRQPEPLAGAALYKEGASSARSAAARA